MSYCLKKVFGHVRFSPLSAHAQITAVCSHKSTLCHPITEWVFLTCKYNHVTSILNRFPLLIPHLCFDLKGLLYSDFSPACLSGLIFVSVNHMLCHLRLLLLSQTYLFFTPQGLCTCCSLCPECTLLSASCPPPAPTFQVANS